MTVDPRICGDGDAQGNQLGGGTSSSTPPSERRGHEAQAAQASLPLTTASLAVPASSSSDAFGQPHARSFTAPTSTISKPRPKQIPFTKSEDQAILRGIDLYGHIWSKVAAHFAQAAPQNSRSLGSIKNRYYNHLDGRTRGEKVGDLRGRGRQAEGLQQGQQPQAKSGAGSSHNQAQSASSSVFASSSSSITTPPLPPTKPTTSAGRAWTPNKEKQLLRLALHHQGQDCIATQAQAIHEDFCSLYPSIDWSLEEVQVKVGQLMQSEFGEEGGGEEEGLQEDEEELEEGEIREGERHMEQRAGVEGEQDESVDLGVIEVEGEEAARGPAITAFEGCAAAVDQAEDLQVAGSAWLAHNQEARASLSSEQDSATAPRTSHPPREHSRQAAKPRLATEQIGAAQNMAPTPILTFDHDVKTLSHGLRFERLPPNCKVLIFTPSHYKIRRLAPSQAAAGAAVAAAQGASQEEQDAEATFVFHVLSDRSVVGVKLPARTQTHMEVVPLSVGEVGESEGGFVAESHWDAECGFKVVFAAGL